MTLPGGPAAKLGNRFEKLSTLSELVRMLRGETDSLRIEVPGLHGVEFVVQSGAHKEFHQAKRSHQSGKWSIATLESAGVLKTIGDLLRHETHRFVFVSGSDARELSDLCEAAAKAESLDEFTRDFLAAGTRAEPHKAILRIWNCGELDAWKMLRRVKIHTINDNELETKVRWGLAALYMDPVGAQHKLATILDDAVHRTIGRDELIRDLREAGYPLRQVPGNARHAVAEATRRYVAGARRNLIQGSVIHRDAVATVVDRLTGDSPSDCALTGQAGMGKTTCVIEIVAALWRAGVHVLAFRLDRHMSATSTEDLGRRLELEESPTLVLGAASKADGKRAVLIVDQLDAVSAMSGRSSDALDIVDRLLREAKPGDIRTLVVCRSFDYQHDPQLHGLFGDERHETVLHELSVDNVRKVLSKGHFDLETLDTQQLNLLRRPQNLSLFLDSDIDKSTRPSFVTTKDLFDSYWECKRKWVGQRTRGANDQWMQVIGTVCREMTRTQQLSVRREKLDHFSPAYLDQYVSENVLTRDGDTYGFGHESFFDYCFARIFATNDGTLASELKSSEQHLFRRAQVRQVLAYLRDADFQRYVNELRDLVSDSGVRTHIKDLVFALLATVDDPRDGEWDLWMDWVQPVFDAMDRDIVMGGDLAKRAWDHLFGAPSWFKELDGRGMIKEWLEDGRRAEVAVRYLRERQYEWPDRVAVLLAPYADQGGDWPNRFRALMVSSPLHTSRRLFDLFLKLVDKGTFDVQTNSGPGGGLWTTCVGVAKHRPEWVPEVLAHQLRRCVVRSLTASASRYSSDAVWRSGLGRYDSADKALEAAVEHAPRAFVHHVLPAVLETSQAASKCDGSPPIRDAVWPYLIKNDIPTLADACLYSLAKALAVLAGQGEDLQNEIASLSNCQTYVANHLLLALYRGGVARYADEAVLAFCEQPWRFQCGYSDSSYWSATETIKAIVRHCKPANQAKLEREILAYVAPYERTKEGARYHGRASFNLLAALPKELCSANASRRFSELKRKFQRPAPAPRGIVTGWVASPIPSDAATKMKDEQWIHAIAAYPTSRSRSTFKGGADELAEQLSRCATKEPGRFANIGLQLPSTTNPVYFLGLLRGLAEGSVKDAIKVRMCQRVFEYAKDECGRYIADLLATASDKLPDAAIQMLISLATEAHDSYEEAWPQDAGSGQPHYVGDIYTNGINTTCGRAVMAIAQMIAKDASYIQRFGPVLDQLAGDPRPSVASCVAMALRTVAFHDAERGLSLLLRMDFNEERLLATRPVCDFMRENLLHGFADLKGLILRALRSAHPDVRQAGAGLACLAALHHEDALDLAAEALDGDGHQRLGVAEVASAYIGTSACREWCEDALKSLFTDDDAHVRRCAASCFRHVGEGHLYAYGDLIEAFCTSPAFEEDPSPLIYALNDARTQLPGTVCMVCESFLDRLSSQPRDIRQYHPDGYTVVDLIFRLYQHHQNDEWTRRALDLIDRVCLEPDGAARGFDDFDR